MMINGTRRIEGEVQKVLCGTESVLRSKRVLITTLMTDQTEGRAEREGKIASLVLESQTADWNRRVETLRWIKYARGLFF